MGLFGKKKEKERLAKEEAEKKAKAEQEAKAKAEAEAKAKAKAEKEAKAKAEKEAAAKKAAPKKETAKKEEKPAAEAKKPAAETKKPAKIYHVSKRKEDGKWQVKFSNGQRAIKLFDTQKAAIEYAEALADNQDSSITIHKVDGKIRKQNYAKK